MNPTSNQLPNLECKTCHKWIHQICFQKWIKTSNKNECPLCKSQFL